MSIKKREQTDWLLKRVFKATGFITIALLAGLFFMLVYNSNGTPRVQKVNTVLLLY